MFDCNLLQLQLQQIGRLQDMPSIVKSAIRDIKTLPDYETFTIEYQQFLFDCYCNTHVQLIRHFNSRRMRSKDTRIQFKR